MRTGSSVLLCNNQQEDPVKQMHQYYSVEGGVLISFVLLGRDGFEGVSGATYYHSLMKLRRRRLY